MLTAGVDPSRIYEDLASGRHDARPGLIACLKAIQPGNTLVVWKLDRLGRDLCHLVNTVDELRTRNVGLKVLTGAGAQIDTTTANGRLAFGIFAAFAEFERELIADRTMAGLAAARARGRMGGRPRKMDRAALMMAMAAMADRRAVDAHDLHPKTLTALKRLIELVAEGGGQLSIVLVGHPKLKNDLRRPKMEEVGDRTPVFEFGGLRDRQRDYIDWVLKASLDQNTVPDEVLTDEAATLLAARLKTPLQIGQHLVRAFEAGFEIGAKPIDAGVVEAVLSKQLDELEPQLTRNGYDLRSLVEQFDAKPAEIRRLLRGDLDAGRAQELMDEMRAAGLPT